jgi:DNA-binding transcriptional ArsR family regulator
VRISSGLRSSRSRVPETPRVVARRDFADHVFDALADPTRRRIVERLGRAPATAGEIADELPVSRQAVVKHLALLEHAGLVCGERDGRRVVFRLTPAPFAEAAGWMHDVGAAWDRRLDKLARRVTKSS